MNIDIIKIKFLHPHAKLPIYASNGAAGFDIFAPEDKILQENFITKVPLGLSLEIPKGFCLLLFDRSGMAVKGIHHIGGVIDSDYRGEVSSLFFNTNSKPYIIKKGDRIVQGLIIPVVQTLFQQVDELNITERGGGGFHSTGK